MNKHYELIGKVITITNVMAEINKNPRDFGLGFMIYPSEIHTVEAIGAHGEINAAALSRVLGITNGAVTQMADRLIKKGLIEKFRLVGNSKEIYFRLTEQGKIADRAHDDFHGQGYENLAEYLDSLEPSQIEAISCFLDLYIENLP